MKSPYATVAPALRERGYSVIALAGGQKYPTIKQWTRFCVIKPDESDHLHWMASPDANIGLCLGPSSGVVAVDFDNDIDGLHASIYPLLPPSPVIKRGKKGFTAFYKYSGEQSEQFSKNGEVVFEILSKGRQTVLPPSIHPETGQPYKYDLTPLADFYAHDLPAIPSDVLAHIRNTYFPRVIHQPKPLSRLPSDSDDIMDCLTYIPADISRDEWLRVMFAIKDSLGDDGYSVFDRWSATGSKYKGPKDTQTTWLSAKREGITVNTLHYYSYHYGRPKPQPTIEQLVEIIPGGNLSPDLPKSVPVHLLNAPGLVGKLLNYIESSAIYPQPLLSLAAAISFAGAIYGHRIQSETGLRTNFYTLGVAPSGAGKDHARKVISRICADLVYTDLLSGDPASGAGLLTSLTENKDNPGVRMILWDEFGKVLSLISEPRAPAHLKEIENILMTLYSSASSFYVGKQYANRDKKSPRHDIDQPCLNIYGTTVPSRFYESITSGHALDGFLARLLVFESEEYALEPLPDRKLTETPEPLLSKLTAILKMSKNNAPEGNVSTVTTICPLTISYDDDARKLINDFQRLCRQRCFDNQKSSVSSVYARAAENAIKLALVAHEGDSIPLPVMQWAIEVATHCARRLIVSVHERISSTQAEADIKKLLRVFIENPNRWLTKAEVTVKSQWCQPSARRNDYLAQLVETGQIQSETIQKNSRATLAYGLFQKNTPQEF